MMDMLPTLRLAALDRADSAAFLASCSSSRSCFSVASVSVRSCASSFSASSSFSRRSAASCIQSQPRHQSAPVRSVCAGLIIVLCVDMSGSRHLQHADTPSGSLTMVLYPLALLMAASTLLCACALWPRPLASSWQRLS